MLRGKSFIIDYIFVTDPRAEIRPDQIPNPLLRWVLFLVKALKWKSKNVDGIAGCSNISTHDDNFVRRCLSGYTSGCCAVKDNQIPVGKVSGETLSVFENDAGRWGWI